MHRLARLVTSWPGVLVCVIILRLSINAPALLGARGTFLDTPALNTATADSNPRTFPGIWSRWDSGYYLKIAADGYSQDGPEVNFWPGYPIAMRTLSLGDTALLPWAGVGVSFFSFLLATVILWRQVSSDFGAACAWTTVITASVAPTGFFFSAIYSESLFLLFSVLVYWYAAHRRYWLSAVFVALASITRIYGILLLVLLLAEMLSDGLGKNRARILAITAVASSLLIVYGGFLWVTQGSPLAAVTTQQSLMQRSISLPGLSLIHGISVALWGHGGFEGNWFMRIASAHDSFVTVLFLACTIAGFYILRRRSLAYYGGVAMLALVASHGPYTLGVYSMSRYVLPLFPSFIAMAVIMTRYPKLKWFIWLSMILLQYLLTAWFATGRWVA